MVTSVLLIAELHARWERWAQAWCTPGNQLNLIIQSPLESLGQFTKRIDASIDRLTAAHCRLSQVLLVPAANGNAATLRARHEIIHLASRKLADRPTLAAVRVLSTADWRTAPCSTPRG